MESYLQSCTAPRIPGRHDAKTLLGNLDARKPTSYRINAGLLTGAQPGPLLLNHGMSGCSRQAPRTRQPDHKPGTPVLCHSGTLFPPGPSRRCRRQRPHDTTSDGLCESVSSTRNRRPFPTGTPDQAAGPQARHSRTPALCHSGTLFPPNPSRRSRRAHRAGSSGLPRCSPSAPSRGGELSMTLTHGVRRPEGRIALNPLDTAETDGR